LEPGCTAFQRSDLLRVLEALRKKQIELALLIDCIDGNITDRWAVKSVGVAAVEIDEASNTLRVAAAD
jgi:hypothetical protein